MRTENAVRYEKGHKAATRRHIVSVAARRFRESGVDAVGLSGLMADAGLTNGAFYAHFESKEDLVRNALIEALDRQRDNLNPDGPNSRDLNAILHAYLKAEHRDDPGTGCPSAALVGEVSRRPPETRRAYTERLVEIIDLIGLRLADFDAATRHRRATAIYALAVGAIQLARAVSDPELSDEILSSGFEAGLALAANAPDPTQTG